MKSEELMLNDWVFTPEGEPAQVYQIYNGVVALTAPSPNLCNVECLQPIKLTRELLHNNGFTGGNYKSYQFYDIDESSYLKFYWFEHRLEKWHELVDEWGHTHDRDISYTSNSILYLHQLQHAFRWLNIEKEWKV